MVKYRKPLEDNIIIRVLHLHAFAHFFSSLFSPISKQHFYDLRDNHKPDKLLSDYDHIIKNPKIDSSSLKNVLFRLFKKDMIIGIVMSTIVALLLIQSPLIMKKILLHVADTDITAEETKAVKGVITMFVTAFIIKIFFNELTERKFFMIGLKLQLLLTNLFMRKITKLSLNDLELSKPEIMNYLIVQIKKVETFFKKGSLLFSQPPVLILGFLMILIKNFWLGLLILQIIFGFIIIKVLAQNHMQNYHHHKLQIQQKRIYTNVELFKQMRQLRTIGYENLIPQKQQQYIKKQNKYNIKYMAFKHLIQLFLCLIPFIFYLVYFLLRLRQQSFKKLDLVDAYIVLIYVQILVTPLKNIRYILLYFQDLKKAMNKLQEFFNLPEVDKIVYSNKNMLVSEIKFSKIKINKENIKVKSAQKSDVQYFLLEKNNFVTSPGRKTKNYFQIPFSIGLKPGDHVVALGQKDEGSVLLSLLAGNIDLQQGEIQYNGKIAYVSSQLWFVQGTIKDNILMGQPQNEASLSLVYDLTQLSTDFQTQLLKKDLTFISSNSLTQSHKRRISLARALYINADIYLLDNIFKGVNSKTARIIYSKLSKHLYQKTMIVATNRSLQLQPNDKVLLFTNYPRAVQFGQVQNLQSSQNSKLKRYLQTNVEDQQEQSITIEQQKIEIKETKVQRQPNFPIQVLKSFLSYDQSKTLLMPIICILCIFGAQLLKLQLDLDIGKFHQIKIFKEEIRIMHSYFILLIGFVVEQVLFSLVQIMMSNKISKGITRDLSKSIAQNIPIEDIQGEHQTSLIQTVSKDHQQVFILIHRYPTLISYFMVLFTTISLLLYCTPKLIIYIIGLLAFNFVFFYFLLRTQRQIRRYKAKFTKNMYDNVYTFIEGVQTIKHYADPKQFFIMRAASVTDYAVYIQNQRFVWHAVKMVGQITTLLITYWTLQFAISKRTGLSKQNIIYLFAAITYCLKLSGLIYYIIQQLLKNISKVFSIINVENQETNNKMVGKLNFSNLRVEGLIINDDEKINFSLSEGQKVSVYGPRAKASILNHLITKTIKNKFEGKIFINNINIKEIPRKMINKQIYHLTVSPFVFTGSIRQNIDPFNCYKESQIMTAIRLSGLTQILYQQNETKCSQQILIYEKVNNNVRQAINLARAILKKPLVLIDELSQYRNYSKIGESTFNQLIQCSAMIVSNPTEQLAILCTKQIKI